MEEDIKEHYELPAWRLNEIICEVVKLLQENNYHKDSFDYRKMIVGQSVKIKKYSDFLPENLQAMQSLSLSFCKDGLCMVFKNSETDRQCKMIAYNDSKSDSEIMTIILHEYGHIHLRHTVQSINAEMEAICFSTAMVMLINMERQFHFGKTVIESRGKDFFLTNFKKGLARKAS